MNANVMGLTKEQMEKEMREGFIDSNVSLFDELEVKRLVQAVTAHAFEVCEPLELQKIYKQTQDVAKRIKKTLTDQGAVNLMVEMVIAGALLAPSFKGLETLEGFHTLEFETYITKHGLTEGVPEHIVEGVSRIVRSYLGPNSVFKEFYPKPGSPEYLVATAYQLLVD